MYSTGSVVGQCCIATPVAQCCVFTSSCVDWYWSVTIMPNMAPSGDNSGNCVCWCFADSLISTCHLDLHLRFKVMWHLRCWVILTVYVDCEIPSTMQQWTIYSVFLNVILQCGFILTREGNCTLHVDGLWKNGCLKRTNYFRKWCLMLSRHSSLL